MHAWAALADLEVPAGEPQEREATPRAVGKRTLTARLQPRGATARTRTTLGATGDGEPLPAALVAAVRGTLGEDVSGVRVHADGQADALGVQAFAVGEAIHVAAGAYQPGSASGLALVGHEVAHVLQQRAGRVGEGERERGAGAEGTSDRGDVAVVIEPALEAEADQLGDTLAARAAAPTGEAFDLDAFLAGPTAARQDARAGGSSAPSASPPVLQGKDAGGGGTNPTATGAARSGATSTATPSASTDTWTAGDIPADEPTALARWRKGYDRFARVYQWGLTLKVEPDEVEPSRETLFRNTCEWIRDGHAKVCLVAPVHAAAQDAANGTCFDDHLYYPASTPVVTRSSPDWSPASFYGYYQESKNTLSLVDVGADRWDDHALIGTMIHEIQHDADSGPGGATYPDSDDEYSQYKSEFRAWWIDPIDGPAMGDPSRPAPNSDTVTATDPRRPGSAPVSRPATGFKNERQYNIFLNLAQTPPPSVYDYVAERFVFDQPFRNMVVAYDTPVGGNLLNSVRVEHLVQLICGHGAFSEIKTYAHDSLDAADRTFLLDKARSADFWAMAADHLSARYVTELEAAIRAGGGATAPADGKYQYTVVAGDTLSLIAGRLLGDPMRYPDICALPENPQSIRDNPDLIEPGWTLWIPGA